MKHLREVVNDYNNSCIHRTIGMTPAEASLESSQEKLKKRYQEIRSKRLPDFSPLDIGQAVRIYRWKSSRFAKGSERNWSSKLFKISEILKTNPITYKLVELNENGEEEPVIGSFYRSELLPSKFGFGLSSEVNFIE